MFSIIFKLKKLPAATGNLLFCVKKLSMHFSIQIHPSGFFFSASERDIVVIGCCWQQFPIRTLTMPLVYVVVHLIDFHSVTVKDFYPQDVESGQIPCVVIIIAIRRNSFRNLAIAFFNRNGYGFRTSFLICDYHGISS
ncbi:hypothetical protein D9M72_536970 [compost metagenome]